MKSMRRIVTEITLLFIALVSMVFLVGAAQVADAPPFEDITPIDVQCYQIDDDGRIMDSDDRVRGWVKGDDVYGPDFELRYRLSGRHLEDLP